MPMMKSDMSIAPRGTNKENLISFLIKGIKMIPASIGVKFGGWGIILLKIKSEVRKIMPLR
jgi:hypothetical protein